MSGTEVSIRSLTAMLPRIPSIMESFMDTLKIRSRPGKGTVVTMRKRIAQRTGHA